jgi:hypothetical protein
MTRYYVGALTVGEVKNFLASLMSKMDPNGMR